MSSRTLHTVVATMSVALVLVFSPTVQGAVYTWDGGGGDDNWSTDDNWDPSGAAVSASDTTVVFKGMTRTTPVQDIAAPFVLNRLELIDGSSGFVVSGNAIEFQVDGTTQSVLYSNRTATSTISNDIGIAAGTTLTATFTTYSVNLNGLISGSGTLVKGSNAGGLNLNQVDNTFTGGLIYNNTGGANGQWNLFGVNASGALGDGLVTLNGGNTNPHDATTNNRPGGLIFHNTTTHDNSFLLQADSPISIGDPWSTSQSDYSVTLSGQIDLNGNDLVLRGPGSGTISGAIINSDGVNSGGVTKIGSGTWTLAGTNTYDGATKVSAGILRLGSTSALGNTSGVTVADGATLDFNGNVITGKVFTIAGAGVDGQGALSSTGYLIGQIGVTLTADATIGVHGAATNRLDIGLSQALNGNAHLLTKVGIGQLPVRSDAGSFGGFQVDEGTLYFETDQTNMAGTPIVVNSGATVGMYYTRTINAPITLNGATLAHLGDGASTTSTWSGPITVNSTSSLTTYGGNLSITGDISGAGGLTVAGPNTVTLSGSNSYAGDTTVNSGILDIASADGLGDTSQVTVASGATVDLNDNAVEYINFSLSGTGSSGQGALVSSGAAIGHVGITLNADATISVTGGRFDIGRGYALAGNGYTLTKIGGGSLPVRSNAGSFGAIQVDAGLLYFETEQTGMGSTEITVNSGATMGMYYGYAINAPVILEGGTLSHVGGGGTSTWSGSITVNEDSFITPAGGNLRITGALSGDGNVAVVGGNTLYIDTSGSVGGMRGTAAVELGTGVTLTVGGSDDDNMWNSPVSGAGAVRKVGNGLLAMSNSGSTYTGGTIVSGGDLAALEAGALGTGTVTLNGGTLNLAVPVPGVSGFGGDGDGWTANGSASIAGDVLTATTAGTSQAGSAFYDLPVATSDFTVNFTYLADDSPGDPADGLAIVFQTDVRGPTALGSSGGGLGYRGISASAAVGFNLYPLSTSGVSNQVFLNGEVTGGYASTSPVSLYGTPVDVELTYSGATLTVTLTQGSDTYEKVYTGVDLSGSLGSWAFLGLTGGTGDAVARQQISNFSYVSAFLPNTAYSNDLAVEAGAVGNVGLMVTPVSMAYSMGNLAMGSGATLGVAPIDGSPADLSYDLTLGATTLDGPATFDVANNGAGTGVLALGAVGQTNAASLTKTGAGTLALTGENTYTGPTDVQGGTLTLSSTSSNNTIASSADIRIADGTVLDVTGLAGAGGLTLASGQNLHGNGTVTGSVTVGTGSSISAGDSPGHLLIDTGDYNQATLATMLAELSGNTQGATTDGYDWIEVVGTAGFADGAVVDVDLLDSFIPALGDSFDILTATGGISNTDTSGLVFDFTDAEITYEWSAQIVSLGGAAEALRLRVVPEPSSGMLLLLGLGALVGLTVRRRSR